MKPCLRIILLHHLWFQLHVSNSYFCLAQFDSSVLFLATKYILTDTCEMVLLWLPSLGQAQIINDPLPRVPEEKPIILDEA